jgi:myo-inositol-1(or 4)-monophosphatase
VSKEKRYRKAGEVATLAALEAGRLIAHHAGRLMQEQVREKAAHDLVTEIDETSQRLISERLLEAFPDSTVLGEEGTVLDGIVSETVGWQWIVDPIDGTTNFAHGVPPYAVSIGLVDDGKPMVGVVYEVTRDELFSAVDGQGLLRNGRPASVSRRGTLDDSLLVTGFPYARFRHMDDFLAVLGRLLVASRGVRRSGSAATDLAYVACGRFDAFFENGLMPWDMAAGAVLVAEGGGRTTDYRGVHGRLFGRQIVASNGLIHDALLEILETVSDLEP